MSQCPKDKHSEALKAARQYFKQGHLQKAEALFREVLDRDKDNIEALASLAMLFHQSDRSNSAIPLLKKAIAIAPKEAWLHNNLGAIYKGLGKRKQAITYFRQAIHLAPALFEAHINLGNVLQAQGDLPGAATHYRKAIAINPSSAVAHSNLGVTLHAQGLLKEAIRVLKKAIKIDRDYASAYYNLGNAFCTSGVIDDAISSFCKAIQLDPSFSYAYANLGVCLLRQLDYHGAVTCLQQAISLNPSLFHTLNHLGTAFVGKGDLEEAISCYRRSLKLNEDQPDILYKMGYVFQGLGRISEAIKNYLRALKLRPEFAEVYMSLGNAYKYQGKIDKALACYQEALRRRPNHDKTHSNLLLALNYRSNPSRGDIFSEHCNWAERHINVSPHRPPLIWNRTERVRIGYVSPDFRLHSLSYFIAPLLQAHQRDRFHVHAYAEVWHPDTVTERFKENVESWCNTTDMTIVQMADQIRNDKIHILIDLAGHTANNRLRVFGLRPAPIQITYLGYPNTTGLNVMDYRITDDRADPEGESERFYTEKLLRVPGGFLCYRPNPNSPEVSPPPVLRNGFITFGAFNALYKLSPEVISTWAGILKKVSSSRLLLKSFALDDNPTCEIILKQFTDLGISRDRIICRGLMPEESDHLRMYEQVDIALDTFPYNGTTTICEAMWMGVPVVTFVGDRHACRTGYSILRQVGLEAFCANSLRAYADIAVKLASDKERLCSIRSELRGRMKNSPLCDERRIAEEIEKLYITILSEFNDCKREK